MPNESTKDPEISRTLCGKLENIKKDAKTSILGLRGHPNDAVNEDTCNAGAASQTRMSRLFRAFAYEDYPDSHVESARATTITKSKGLPITVKVAGTPPRRPPRPDSWIKAHPGGDPWTDISLESGSSEKRVESADTQARSKSSASQTSSASGWSETTEIGKPTNSIEKVEHHARRPVGFWHTDLKKQRQKALGKWFLLTILLSAFVFGILSLYWTVVASVDKNLSSLSVFVVNFETQSDALVGPVVIETTEKMVRDQQNHSLGFVTMNPAMFNKDPLAVREAIWEEKAWAAIVINSNATQLLRQAVGLGNTTYDPNGAIQILYNEAREQDLYSDYLYPMMQEVQEQIVHEFGTKWTQEIMSNGAISKTYMRLVPQAINPAIGFSTYNIRPFLPAAATPAFSIGLVYWIVITFFSFILYRTVHIDIQKSSGNSRLRFWQFILWRWTTTVTAYLILSLAYSLVSVAFGFPFGNSPASHLVSEVAPSTFYKATFLVYWLINFFGMMALGLASENAAMFLGISWTALWLIFWIVTNIATASYAIQLEPVFYRWGYIWPLHNMMQASRTTLFDLHSNLAVNFGVLIAWVALNTALFPFSCLCDRWRSRKVLQREESQLLD